MSKYNRKQRSTEQDEFVSFWAKTYEKLAPYARAIAITVGVAVALWFAAWGFTAWREGKAEAAAELFGRAVRIYDAELLGDAPPPKVDEENPIPRFKTTKERADATLAELDKLDKGYGGTRVAQNALVFRAGVKYDLGEYDEAARLYQQYLDGAKDGALALVAREGLALTDEARGKLDDALAKYQTLEPSGKGDFFRDRALYGQARVHAKKGDVKKAAALYRDILAKVPGSALRDEVENRLLEIEGT